MAPTTRTVLLVLAALAFSLHLLDSTADQPKPTPSRYVGLKFQDPRETEFLKAVLTSLGHAYTSTKTASGELVEWASTDTAQEQEIQDRVLQYWLIITQCKGMSPPPPTQTARKSFSCEG